MMESSLLAGYAVLLCYGTVLGFLFAIPIGAVQLQVVKLSLAGRPRAAIATAFGSGTSDLCYGALTLFGLAPFLMEERFQAFFYLLGAAVLAFLLHGGVRELRRFDEPGMTVTAGDARGGFLLGFTLAATNPGIVLWWIVGFGVFMDLGIVPEVTAPLRFLFVLSGVTGLVGYLAVISMAAGRYRRIISSIAMRRFNIAIVVILAALVLYFAFRAVRLLAR